MKLMCGRKAGIISMILFRRTMSHSLCIRPHEIPAITNSIPLNPIVGSVIGHGRKEQNTAQRNADIICVGHLRTKRQSTLASKCQIFACEIEYSICSTIPLQDVKPYFGSRKYDAISIALITSLRYTEIFNIISKWAKVLAYAAWL